MSLSEKTLMLGKIEGKRSRGWQRIRWLDSVSNSVDMNLSKLREMVKERGAWCSAVPGIAAQLGDNNNKIPLMDQTLLCWCRVSALANTLAGYFPSPQL